MAWHFLPTGLLMPAAVPMDKADPKFTEGKYDFQIRARAVSHLEDFIKFYMEPGTYHEEIQLNPDMDYNCRFYTTREAYADAIRKQIMEIDYEKFKPTAEHLNKDGSQRKDGKLYHSILNGIWSELTRLGKPGGKWAYDKSSKYSDWWGNYSYKGKTVGSTFLEGEKNTEPRDWDDWENRKPIDHVNELLAELQDIPGDQWFDYLKEDEWDLLVRFGYAEPVDFSDYQEFSNMDELPAGFSLVDDDDPMWRDQEDAALAAPLPDEKQHELVDSLLVEMGEPKADWGTPETVRTQKFVVPDLSVTVKRVKAARQTRKQMRAEKRRVRDAEAVN